ncbi:MAG: response regulator transcription factor, partial [Bacteroidia bacterium]|nr:response regulator transcription factor [Bacteroidia bacterium]
MIKCIILEDDELASKSLQRIVSKIDSLECIGAFENPVEVQNAIDLAEVDLIFLDVEMPEISGLDFVKTLSHPPRVIVTTSKSDFAVGAFEIEALDFLLKPVEMPDVLSALQKYQKIELQHPVGGNEESLFVKVDAKLVNLKFNDIQWIEALGDYVRFHTEKKRYVVKSTLTAIDAKINLKNFVRVHRSFMVNTSHIRDIDDSSLVIGDKLIPVSRGNRPE